MTCACLFVSFIWLGHLQVYLVIVVIVVFKVAPQKLHLDHIQHTKHRHQGHGVIVPVDDFQQLISKPLGKFERGLCFVSATFEEAFRASANSLKS